MELQRDIFTKEVSIKPVVCSVPECHYSTPEGIPTWDILTEHLVQHCQEVHLSPAAVQQASAAPVRQVKDSEDDATQPAKPMEVAKDISTTEVFKSPVANAWIECQKCSFLTSWTYIISKTTR